MIFPNAPNGDALRGMAAEGDDLTRARNIDFNVAFADERTAAEFARHFRVLGHDVAVGAAETDQEFPRDVVVVRHMAPSHENATGFLNLLQSVADRLGGHNDGWGCFSASSSN